MKERRRWEETRECKQHAHHVLDGGAGLAFLLQVMEEKERANDNR